MYSVDKSENTDKFLEKLDNHIKERIIEKLKKLAENPIPSDTKFITRNQNNEKIFRYRIGDFRVLYTIKEKEKIVLIAKIDKRAKVYD